MTLHQLLRLSAVIAITVAPPWRLARSATIEIVAPNSLAGVAGNSADPFIAGSVAPSRNQQVVAASEFGAISQGGGYITAIDFRGDENSRLSAGAVASNL